MWASAQTEGGEAVNMPDSDIRILYEDSEILSMIHTRKESDNAARGGCPVPHGAGS